MAFGASMAQCYSYPLTHLHDLLAAGVISVHTNAVDDTIEIMQLACSPFAYLKRAKKRHAWAVGLHRRNQRAGMFPAFPPPALNQPNPVTKIENHSRGPVRFVPAATENTHSNVEAPLGPVRAAPHPPLTLTETSLGPQIAMRAPMRCTFQTRVGFWQLREMASATGWEGSPVFSVSQLTCHACEEDLTTLK